MRRIQIMNLLSTIIPFILYPLKTIELYQSTVKNYVLLLNFFCRNSKSEAEDISSVDRKSRRGNGFSYDTHINPSRKQMNK